MIVCKKCGHKVIHAPHGLTSCPGCALSLDEVGEGTALLTQSEDLRETMSARAERQARERRELFAQHERERQRAEQERIKTEEYRAEQRFERIAYMLKEIMEHEQEKRYSLNPQSLESEDASERRFARIEME